MQKQINMTAVTILALMTGLFTSTAAVASAEGTNDTSGFLSQWLAVSDRAKEEQPHWVTPMVTTTPRLEQEYRYDQVWQNRPNSVDVQNYGFNKGLELIPSENTEVVFGVPAYQVQKSPTATTDGFTDASLLLKYRFLSANEEKGNYIVTGFIGTTLPTGGSAFTYGRAIPTVTIAGGKGWGTRDYGFDIQSTLGAALADDVNRKTGQPVTWNTAFQAHVFEKMWPEIETTYTHFTDGPWTGKDQAVVTYGLNLGRFQVTDRARFVLGVGYQQTVSSFHANIDSGWILAGRISF